VPGVLGVLVLTLLLLEAVARVVFALPPVLDFNRIRYSPLLPGTGPQPPEGLDQRSLPAWSGRSFIWSSLPDGVEEVHHLNRHGFRDRRWAVEKQASVRRVALVGDSMVEGLMVDDRQTIPAHLRRLLQGRDGAGWEVFNLGVAAAGLREYAAIIRDFVPVFEPDVVVLVLYANDFHPVGYSPGWWERGPALRLLGPLTSRLAFVLRMSLQGRPLPYAWRTEPVPFLQPVPSRANPWSDAAKAREWEAFVAPEVADAMRQGRFNPFVVDSAHRLAPRILEPFDVGEYLADAKKLLRARGVDLHVVYIPTQLQVSDSYARFQGRFCSRPIASQEGEPYQAQARMLARRCRELGLAFLDMTARFRDAERAGTPAYWDYDMHLRPSGYEAVARELLQLVK
jgi:lysophospholipase L1-like esterase